MLIIPSQAVVNDSQTFGAMAEGIECVSHLITRYAILEKLYVNTHRKAAADDQLKESIVKLYSAVLRYLSKAARYYHQSTTSAYNSPLYSLSIVVQY